MTPAVLQLLVGPIRAPIAQATKGPVRRTMSSLFALHLMAVPDPLDLCAQVGFDVFTRLTYLNRARTFGALPLPNGMTA